MFVLDFFPRLLHFAKRERELSTLCCQKSVRGLFSCSRGCWLLVLFLACASEKLCRPRNYSSMVIALRKEHFSRSAINKL